MAALLDNNDTPSEWQEKYPSLATPPTTSTTTNNQCIAPNQWQHFHNKGWVVLPASQVFQHDKELVALQTIIDAIMLGKADLLPGTYEQMMFQLDSTTGNYEDSGSQTLGHKGATLRYRKIQNLDLCPTIMDYCQKPIFKEACQKIYGKDVPIASFRTMFFNKPPRLSTTTKGGTALPWHQDRWKYLDRDPLLNVYLALDASVPETGCMKIISGSHTLGVINPEHHSAFLSAQNCQDMGLLEEGDGNRKDGAEYKVEDFWLHPGEVALMHNWVIHCSGTNSTDVSRRALSISYMDARSQLKTDNFNSYIGGELKTTGYPEGATKYPLIFQADDCNAEADDSLKTTHRRPNEQQTRKLD